MNKKAAETLAEQIVFIIFVLFFSLLALFAINRAGSQGTIYEQAYSKQIALIIDKAKPGTDIQLDISKLYDISRKNKFDEKSIIFIDNANKKVIVRLSSGKGYQFTYFNDVNVLWDLKPKERRLYMEVRK
jgi:hypothetical protein